ncbi:MAG: aldolase/citrate lyase family protein [Microvirga sp.]
MSVSFSDRRFLGLRGGEPAFAAWCGLPEPTIPGLLAREDFDAVALDMQHGLIDLAAVLRAIPLITASEKPALVRIPVGEFATASRLLDAGASAVIAPMINTLEDARRFGSFLKYPPVGERSWGPHAALGVTGLEPAAYFAQANRLTASLAMIETQAALSILDDILAEPGIDGVFVGPADLSIALSGGERLDAQSPAVEAAIDHVLARTRAAGKMAAIYATTGDRAAGFARKGFDLVAMASDAAMLRLGAQASLQAARG